MSQDTVRKGPVFACFSVKIRESRKDIEQEMDII